MERESDVFDLTLMTTTKSLASSVKNQDWVSTWTEHGKAMQAIKSRYHDSLQVLVTETRPEHLPRKKAELQQQFRKELAGYQATLNGYEAHISQLRRTTTPQEKPNEMAAVLQYLREQEIRTEIRKLDPLELRAEYESRLTDTTGQHDLWLAAVESSPIPLLPGEIIDRGKEARALRALAPEVRQSLRDLESLHEASQHLMGLLSRELPEPDPIAEQAAGQAS